MSENFHDLTIFFVKSTYGCTNYNQLTVPQCGKMKHLLIPEKNSSNQCFSIFFSKNVTFTKFLSKSCDSKFPLLKNFVKLTYSISQNDSIARNCFLQKFVQDDNWHSALISRKMISVERYHVQILAPLTKLTPPLNAPLKLHQKS